MFLPAMPCGEALVAVVRRDVARLAADLDAGGAVRECLQDRFRGGLASLDVIHAHRAGGAVRCAFSAGGTMLRQTTMPPAIAAVVAGT